MNIAIFVRRYPAPYKPYYDSQFADLVERGHELTLFSAGRPEGPPNGKVVRYGLDRRTRYFPETLRDTPRHLRTVVRGVVGSRVKLGEMRAVAGSLGGGTRRVAHLARWLAIRNGAAELCLVHGLGTAVLIPWLKEGMGHLPTAMYYHGGEVPSVAPIPEPLACEVFRRVDIVFTNTEFARRQVVARGCPEWKTAVLPVGFDLRDFPADTERRYRRDGRLHLLCAGRMSEEKGYIHALRALQVLAERGIRDISYAFAGDGYLRPQLERYVRENDLGGQVRFLGTLPPDDLARAMRQADALVLSSAPMGNWAETQAAVVQEAMLMRSLVVTTRTGGVPESIPEVMRRFSVPEADPAALADTIADLYALREDQLGAFGEECRRFVVENYDVRRLNDRLIELTLRAAGAPTRASS